MWPPSFHHWILKQRCAHVVFIGLVRSPNRAVFSPQLHSTVVSFIEPQLIAPSSIGHLQAGARDALDRARRMRARVASTLTMSPLHGHSETTYSEAQGHSSKGWIAGLREAGYSSEQLAAMLEEGAKERILYGGASGTTHVLPSEDFRDYVRHHGGRDTELRVVAASRLLRGSGLKAQPPKPLESHLDPETQERAASLQKLCDDLISERLHQPTHQAGALAVDVHYAMRGSEYMKNPNVVDESLRNAEGKIEAAQARVSSESANRLVNEIKNIYRDTPWEIHNRKHEHERDQKAKDASGAEYRALLEAERSRQNGPRPVKELQEPEDDSSPFLRAVDLPLPQQGPGLSPPAGENGSPRITSDALMAEINRNRALPPSDFMLPNRYQKTIAKAKANAIYRRDLNETAARSQETLGPPASASMMYDFSPQAPRPAPPPAREPWRAPVLRTGRLL